MWKLFGDLHSLNERCYDHMAMELTCIYNHAATMEIFLPAHVSKSVHVGNGTSLLTMPYHLIVIALQLILICALPWLKHREYSKK